MPEKMSTSEDTTCSPKVEEKEKLDSHHTERKEKRELKFDDNWLPILKRSFSLSFYKNCLDLCFKDREKEGYGKSYQMKKMYSFWMEFLQDSFSQKLYVDFRKAAVDDANNGNRYGIQCLFKFFSYGLEKHFHPELYEDFQLYAKYDYESGNLYGLEKFYAFLYYREVNTILEIDNDLLGYLSRFKSLEDFKSLSDSTNKDRLRTLLPGRKRMLALYREVKDKPTNSTKPEPVKVIVVRNLDVIVSLKNQMQRKRSLASHHLLFQTETESKIGQRSRSLNRNSSQRSRSLSSSQERQNKPRSRSAHRLHNQTSYASLGGDDFQVIKSQSYVARGSILKNSNYAQGDEGVKMNFSMKNAYNWGRSRVNGLTREHFQERPLPLWTHGRSSYSDLVHYSRSQHDVMNSPLPYVVHTSQQNESSHPQPLCPDSSKHPEYRFDEILGRDDSVPRPELYPYPVLAHPYITPERRQIENAHGRAGGDRYLNAQEPFIMNEPILVYLIVCPEPGRHRSWESRGRHSCSNSLQWPFPSSPQAPIYHIFPFSNPRRSRSEFVSKQAINNVKYPQRVKKFPSQC